MLTANYLLSVDSRIQIADRERSLVRGRNSEKIMQGVVKPLRTYEKKYRFSTRRLIIAL